MARFCLFIGRFHPLAVHLPIGVILLLAVLEVSTLLSLTRRGRWFPALADGPRGLVLVCAALAALIAAGMGWLLSHSGDYDTGLVHRHRTLGLLVAGLTILLVALHYGRMRGPYAGVFAVTFLALIGAGHSGGTLTHGASFLTEYLPPRLAAMWGISAPAIVGKAPPADPRQAAVFAGLIQPLLAERCDTCHGPTKANGELRLDSWTALTKGGKHGPVFKAGDAAGSHLAQRIDLPLEEKEHMPPKGKAQLTDDDVTLLHWWIDSGAPEGKTLAQMEPPSEIAAVLASRFGLAQWGELPPDRVKMLAAAADLAGKLGIVIRPLTVDGPWLAVNARVRARGFGDDQLRQLAAVAPALEWLDLGETAVTDRGLAALAAMKHLRRLDLAQTAVTDAGLAQLAPLTELNYLNLYGTGVSDSGLAALRPLASLRSLYLWQTRVTPAAARALADRLTDRRKVQRWRDQVAELESRIHEETFYYNLGAPKVEAPAAPAPAPPSKMAKMPKTPRAAQPAVLTPP